MDDDPERGGAVAGLPDDPLVEILSRVPFKSLCRFKCVSKAWRDLIADPLHRRKLPQTLEGIFGVPGYGDLIADPLHRRKLPQTLEGIFGAPGYGDDWDGDDDDAFCGDCGDCSDCGDSLDYVFIDLVGRSAPLVDPSFSFLSEKLPGIKHFRILRSCNGLLLLRPCPVPYADTHTLGYVVCNPATQEWMAVPSSGWIHSYPPEGEEDEVDGDGEIDARGPPKIFRNSCWAGSWSLFP